MPNRSTISVGRERRYRQDDRGPCAPTGGSAIAGARPRAGGTTPGARRTTVVDRQRPSGRSARAARCRPARRTRRARHAAARSRTSPVPSVCRPRAPQNDGVLRRRYAWGQRLVGVQNERVTGRGPSRRALPSLQELEQVPSDAGRAADQLSRVHGNRGHQAARSRRRRIAAAYASRRRRADVSQSNWAARATPRAAMSAASEASSSTRSIAAAIVGVVRIDQQARVAQELRQRAALARDDRYPERHRLERRQPEAFVEGRQDKEAGAFVERTTVVWIDIPQQLDPALERRAAPRVRSIARPTRRRVPRPTSSGTSRRSASSRS